MTAKPFWQSRTVWFNAISLIVAVAGVLVDPVFALDPRVVTGATLIMTIGNTILRTMTNQPIQGTSTDVPRRLRGKG